MHDFGVLIDNIAKKLSPDACPRQKMPRVIWMGSPSRPVRMALPPKQHPMNHGWKDARVNPRLTLYVGSISLRLSEIVDRVVQVQSRSLESSREAAWRGEGKLIRFEHGDGEPVRRWPAYDHVGSTGTPASFAYCCSTHPLGFLQPAFIQDLHQKLWLTEPAYPHLVS